MKRSFFKMVLLTSLAISSQAGFAAIDCPASQNQLETALKAAKANSNGGFGLNMWGTIVDRDGIVCAVAFTGADRDQQWPGSRIISAQKAYTANAFSLPGLALSTANLYTAVQPGGSLFGLQFSNPVDATTAYADAITNSVDFGTASDPLMGKKIGGINVFGGGLALYNNSGTLIGAIGVSGDSSCADHNIAWETRSVLNLDYVPAGVSKDKKRPDNIVYDIRPWIGLQIGASTSGWGHPVCSTAAATVASKLPVVRVANPR